MWLSKHRQYYVISFIFWVICDMVNRRLNAKINLCSRDGCPLQPGSSLQKVLHLTPTLAHNRDKRGIALDGQLKRSDTTLASTTL